MNIHESIQPGGGGTRNDADAWTLAGQKAEATA